jgi:conjugative transfer signal peptidase TraF
VTRRSFRILFVIAAGIAAISVSGVAVMPWRLVFNASRSVPLGWYFILPTRDLRVGELVLARLPDAAAALADARHYLPRSVPILKPVAALPGDRICEREGALTINGRTAAYALQEDREHRPFVAWSGCRALHTDEVLLLSTESAASFDSRYFGPVSRTAILGRTRPLWTW